MQEIEPLHDLYRQEANCQLIRDSFWSRGLLDTYAIDIDGRLAGYGALANKYDQGRLLEFYTFPGCRRHSLRMFEQLLSASEPTHIEAQSNVPLMLTMLGHFAKDIKIEKVLFGDCYTTQLTCPEAGLLRPLNLSDELPVFDHRVEPPGDWVLEVNGEIVATGGFALHYNPPYADLYMEVVETRRRRGFGSYLIQELKTACYERGKLPAARCDIENVASRCTLERAGLAARGHLLVGAVKSPSPEFRGETIQAYYSDIA